MSGQWPEAFDDLLRGLRANRGRPAFIDGTSTGTDYLIDLLTPLVDRVLSIGQRVANTTDAQTAAQLLADIADGAALLLDIDVLFSPALRVDVIPLLRRKAQGTALIVLWPGQITNGRLLYSVPGRPDYMDEPALDAVVLRPVQTHFPDEVPYTVEHYPA